MKSTLAAIAMTAAVCAPTFALADTTGEVRTLYDQFRSAQNARGLGRVRTLLVDSPRFLWVSDGKSFWGADALVKRMAEFQLAEVWRVDPDFGKATIVEVNDGAAYLHVPIALTIGLKAKPDVIGFLVSILCVKEPEGWRIAALFTTPDKSD